MSATPPRFAVVGRVNKGKSSILATLVEEADNDRIRVSPIPGETTRSYVIPLILNGETLVEFLDTPGFNRARQALDWMQKAHEKNPDRPRLDTVRDFVATHQPKGEFLDECLLLEPVLDGAGILYVVDASKPFRPDFLAELEILRWTGRPRMAIINPISGETRFVEEWRQHLGEHFNLTREFNAHQARFHERIRLLRSLLEIDESARPSIQKTVKILEREWNQRRGKAVEEVLRLLENGLSHAVEEPLTEEIATDRKARLELEETLRSRYVNELCDLEARHHRKLVQLYRHQQLDAAADDTFRQFANELFAEETWRVFGLNRWQLGAAGATAGAMSGGALDALAGGTTIGGGILLGGIVGFGATMLKGRALADIRVTKLLGKDVKAGNVVVRAGPPANPNFPWILLDRVFLHYEMLITRAHGRRDDFVVDFGSLKQGAGRSSKLGGSKRRELQRWFTRCASGKSTDETSEVFEIIQSTLEEIESTPITEGSTRLLLQ